MQYLNSTVVSLQFAICKGNLETFWGTVCNFSDPFWRVECPDGDWELTRREPIHGVGLAT